MNHIDPVVWTRAIVLFGIGLSVAGCATRGYERADRASLAIRETRGLVARTQGQLDTTLRSLDELIHQASGDLRPRFELFSHNLCELASCDQAIAGQARSVRRSGDSYFASWDKELKDIQQPDIREQSARRRVQAKESFEKLGARLRNSGAVFRPLLGRLKDTRRALSNDLTVQGTASAAGLAAKVNQDAAEVRKYMDVLVTELDRVAAELSPVKGGADTTDSSSSTTIK